MADTSEPSTVGSTKTWTRPTVEKEKFMPIEQLLSKHFRFSGATTETLADVYRNIKNVRDDLRYHSFWDQSWGKRVFREKLPSLDSVQRFVKASPLYDNDAGRWRNLLGPFVELITAILDYFGGFENRSVCLTHDIVKVDSTTNAENEETFKFVPDITIMGTGDNFSENNTSRTGIFTSTFLGCVSAIEISPAEKVSQNFEHYLVQMAHYAKQCFIEQDNRKFVYALLINERHTHICAFDRSGAHSSTPINIHLRPVQFVRLILGVCSADDTVVGFDTDVYWNSDKTKRFIDTVDKRHNPVSYELVDPRPVFSCRSLRGVGTRFWSAKDPNGNMLLVKDSWRTKDNLPEEGFLEAVEEFVALGPMIAFQSGDLVSDMRDFAPDAVPPYLQNIFWDRIFSRTTFEDGSTSLNQIHTPQEFLSGVRDVIAGNQSLWEDGLFYRRVNFNNFIVKAEDNPAGEPGMIDVNLSFWLNRSTTLLGVRVRPGSPAFTSISELLDHDLENTSPPQAHDHLDDIESIFYALCWVTISYSNFDQQLAPFPSCLKDWDDVNPKVAAYSKQVIFLLDEFLPARHVTSFFGPVFRQLLRQIHGFLRPHIARKIIAANLDIVQPMLSSVTDDFATVLGFFDEAIKQLHDLDEEFDSRALLDMSNTLVTPSPSRRKRALERERYAEDPTIKQKKPKKRASIHSASVSQ